MRECLGETAVENDAGDAREDNAGQRQFRDD